ncbi:TAXI family TRAP transporter solute-binding subunit [Thioclava nitratireducens]|uniref:TAXI family TRAP transporter solute-binding subunit n=1 Tax=Thioclava nitratireducens TaxID=1915078 RepID=UPI00247FDF3C|nr:TAXI family TRAP transporter solute-binding subunit [Thioclava nitratireducens]WGT52637.1 TAXI family TRAP transporter solute-binding subunit [Thioclava nitratireducens]
MKTKVATFLAAIGICVMGSGATAESLNVTLSGGNPSGLWSLLGAGIDRAVKASDPDGVVTYQATGGGFANIALLSRGRTDLGLAHDAEVKLALDGEDPFKGPITGLQAIGYMYNWAPMHFFLRKSIADKYDIDSLDDLAKSGAAIRVGNNNAGNIVANITTYILDEVGFDEKTIEGNGGVMVRGGSSQQADLMNDGRIDMVINGIFVGHSSFLSVDKDTDVVLLDIPQEIIEKTNEKFGTVSYEIPAGSYSNQAEPVETLALGALLVTTEAMPEETAYTLAKDIATNIDEIRSVHSAMKQLSPELLVSQKTLPFHPGAKRAYEELGLLE